MSERERQRRLYVENRLQELASRYGPLDVPEVVGPDIDPSWGPVGSRLQAQDPLEYEHVLRLHQDLLDQERGRTHEEAPARPVTHAPPAEPSRAAPAPRRVLRPADVPATPIHDV